MPSKTMKATKTLSLGTMSTTLLPYRLKKLTLRTPGRDDRQDYPKDGSILAAVLVAEAEGRKVKGAKTLTGTVVNLRLSMPAALGLLRGLLAVVHPLEIAGDKETSAALKHAQEAIDEAVDDGTSMVQAVIDAPPVVETRTLETVPATMENDPPAEGRPLVDVLTEGEDRPDPMRAAESATAADTVPVRSGVRDDDEGSDPTAPGDAPDASAASTPGSSSSGSASPTPDRSSEGPEQNDAYVPEPSVN